MIEAVGLSNEEIRSKSCGASQSEPLDGFEIGFEIIVAFGEKTAQRLLSTESTIQELRGHFHPYRGIKIMPTFHPSDLLKNPQLKREAWADLQLVMRELGLSLPPKTEPRPDRH